MTVRFRRRVSGGRALFVPKCPEVIAQCASCPFLEGNNVEWGEFADSLRAHFGLPPGCRWDHSMARFKANETVQESGGEFACHLTVYDDDMNMRPVDQRKQCRGATQIYREGKV